MTQLLLRALFIVICVVAEGFFLYVIEGMLRELKRPSTLRVERPDTFVQTTRAAEQAPRSSSSRSRLGGYLHRKEGNPVQPGR
jgi:hypothetical protein